MHPSEILRTMENSTDLSENTPRCLECGYILLGLSEFRCPECGTTFDPEYVQDASFRLHLLPWERPELGGSVKRLAQTFILATLHPGRFFASVNNRKDRRISHLIKLIGAYLLASMFFYLASFLVGETISFIRLWMGSGQLSQAWDIKVRVFMLSWTWQLWMPFDFIMSSLLSVAVMAALIRRFFRDITGSLCSVDIAALYCSIVALQAGYMACAFVVFSVSENLVFVFFLISGWATIIILCLPIWFSCRKLLLLSRWKAVGMLIVWGFVYYGCSVAISWLSLIPYLLSHGLL